MALTNLPPAASQFAQTEYGPPNLNSGKPPLKGPPITLVSGSCDAADPPI